jgi:hypothetical protein
MVKGSQEARTAANQYIRSESETADGALAVKIMALKEKTLTALDRTFAVEICFMEAMAGGAGQTMLLEKVSKTLPSDMNPCTPADTLSKLSSLFASQLFHFPSKQAQQSAKLISDAVTQIQLKRRPAPLDDKVSSEVRLCYEKMAFYLYEDVLDSDDEDGEPAAVKRVYGKAALDYLHGCMQQRVAAKDDYTMQDLSYGRFYWLLSAEQNAELKRWTKTLMPSWDGNLGDTSDVDQQSSSARKRARISDAGVDQAVDDMFA